MLKFTQESLVPRVRGPTVRNHDVISIVGAKTPRDGSTKVGINRDGRGAKLQIVGEMLAVDFRFRSQGVITPKPPDMAMEHVQQRRKSIGILNRIRPDAIRSRRIVVVKQRKERGAKNDEERRLYHDIIKP
jgi:hypothetical protein